MSASPTRKEFGGGVAVAPVNEKPRPFGPGFMLAFEFAVTRRMAQDVATAFFEVRRALFGPSVDKRRPRSPSTSTDNAAPP